MSAALVTDEPHIAAGDGWRAEVYLNDIYVTTSDYGDPLTAAIAAILSPTRRQYWAVEYSHETDEGKSVWHLTATEETRVRLLHSVMLGN